MKRFLDVFLSSMGLLFLFPVFVIVGVVVYFSIGWPIIFRQNRPGLKGKPFSLVKFRTMRKAKDLHGKSLPDADRLTSTGAWLRSTSLDELPELWNVLKGDMSIVGPRPLLVEYLPLYSVEQARRHDVRPGITGWAQINGRNAISWDEKFFLDVWYVDNRNFSLDLKIIWLTLHKVVKREGIYAAGEATMPKFMGPGS